MFNMSQKLARPMWIRRAFALNVSYKGKAPEIVNLR